MTIVMIPIQKMLPKIKAATSDDDSAKSVVRANWLKSTGAGGDLGETLPNREEAI